VTIVNCHSDTNKGATALAAGLITRLRRTGLVGDVNVVGLHRHVEPHVDFRHLRSLFPDVAVHPSPLPDQAVADRPRPRRIVEKAAYTGYILARSLAVSGEAAARRNGSTSLRAIADSDLVLERGGPFFKGARVPPNPSLLRYAWPLQFARANGVPYGLVGESVGPLENRWAQRVVRRLFDGAGIASVREELSRATLIEAGVAESQFSTMLDNAFWISPRRSANVERILDLHGFSGNRVLAVTCRDYQDRAVEESYVVETAAGIDALVPGTFDIAAFVPNTFNPAGPTGDDRAMARRVVERVQHKGRIRMIEEDLGPDELASLYGASALVLGRRLHSLILGLVGGARVVGVASTSPKTTGVMQLLGLHEYVVPVRGLRRDDLVERARRALTAQEGVEQRIGALRRKSDETFDAFIGELAARRSR
jgi:polysaccharide pyruvyl transferase WcaK-like protein